MCRTLCISLPIGSYVKNLGRRRLVIVLLLAGCLLALVISEQIAAPSVEVNADMLEPGDIIFVDIYRGWCTACYWDHVAIYIGAGGAYGKPQVMEATYNGGMTRTALDDFLERDAHADMAVMRLKDDQLRSAAVPAAIQQALSDIGKPFNFTATASVPIKLNGNALHCGELIWTAYRAAGIDLDSNKGPFIFPDDIYYSPYLEPAGGRG